MSKKNQKTSILLYGDFVAGHTGFATVTRNLAKEWSRKGYEIDQLAINCNDSDFVQLPFINYYRSVLSRATGNLDDVYGIKAKMLPRALTGLKNSSGGGFKEHYDILFFIQDWFVFQQFAPDLKKLKEEQVKKGIEPTKIVFYCPVDGHFVPEWFKDLDVIDVLIPFSNYGKEQGIKDCKRLIEHLDNVLKHTKFAYDNKYMKKEHYEQQVERLMSFSKSFESATKKFESAVPIYHGTDTNTFYPISEAEADKKREEIFGYNKDKFIISCVNRNQPRKDIARLIEIFAAFRLKRRDSFLYLHMAADDKMGINIHSLCEMYGLIHGKDYGTVETLGGTYGAFKHEDVNLIYNCSDVHMSATLGEGWGLTTTESMAAGCLTILPDNTTAQEIIGKDRGILYDLEESVADVKRQDFNRIRFRADVQSGVKALIRAYEMSEQEWQQITSKAVNWCKNNTWQRKAKEFDARFKQLMK